MKKYFWFFIVFLGVVASPSFSQDPSARSQIDEIDRQMQELKEIRTGYEGRALWHENQAQRLQFMEDELLTAQRHWKIAEEDRKMAQQAQDEINRLASKKKQLLGSP